jgi:lipopolysaccharide export system permease protein
VVVTDQVIPACNRRLAQVIVDDLLSAVLTHMKNSNNSLQEPGKFRLHARQIRGNELLGPIVQVFKEDRATAVGTASAERGFLSVEPPESPGAPPQLALKMVDVHGTSGKGSQYRLPNYPFKWPIPDNVRDVGDAKIENLTYAGCRERAADYRRRAAWCARAAAFDNIMDLLGPGPLETFHAAHVEERRARAADHERYTRKSIEATGEIHLRMQQSAAALMFVMLGVPLAILMQRRDALQTFFVCFVPIVTVFYPSMILAFNAFKELRGLDNPESVAWLLWLPAAGLGLAALTALRKLSRS